MAFFDERGPLVFAHRGGCALGPENTMASFDAGAAAGADGLELDVRLTADGVAVVHHDATLDRTTDASGPINAHTAAALARVDAAYWFGRDKDFPLRGQGVGVPTLAAVLSRHPGVRLIVDLKDDLAELGSAVARDIRAAGAADRVCVAGFGARALDAARRALPEASTSAHREEVRVALCRSWLRWPVRRAVYQGYQVPERRAKLRVVSPLFVRHAHAAGLSVQVWTVNREPDMLRLLAWGVDGLISDHPDAAVEARNRWVRLGAQP
jgi:glycerophosphoryl diester phosphodiesterase